MIMSYMKFVIIGDDEIYANTYTCYCHFPRFSFDINIMIAINGVFSMHLSYCILTTPCFKLNFEYCDNWQNILKEYKTIMKIAYLDAIFLS